MRATSTNHRFTVTDYYRMAEVGLLRPDVKDELLDGIIYDSVSQTPLHAGTTHILARPFFEQPEEQWIVSIHGSVRLDDYNELRPDVMLVKYREDYYTRNHPGSADVFLLVEVADVSIEFDREEKLPVYARAGIQDFWIVNLQDEAIEIFREPHFGGYGSRTVLRAGDQVRLQAFPDIAVDIAELFRERS